MFRFTILKNIIAASVLLVLSGVGLAQVVPPVPEDITGLDGPAFEKEGLHIVRFTVKADGTTDDVEVVGGFTNSMARQFLEDMVEGWTFTPGTVDGAARDFFNQEYIVRNYLNEGVAISPRVEETMAEIGEMLAAGELDDALRDASRLVDRNQVTTAMDYVVAHELMASIYLDMEQPFEALEASNIATMSRVNSEGNVEYIMPQEVLEQAMRKRFMLANALHQSAEVVRTFELMEQGFDIAADDPLRPQAEERQAQLDSPEPLALLARIVDDQWSYQPARRIFTVADIDGRLNRINVRCELGNVELDYEENVDWTLPEALGDCTLDFIGRDDTTFTVYEFVE